jgi:regulator of protease activity HflC (stomatin/prohibitin superfamily)
MLTKDKAAVRMNFNLMFKIVNAEKWALENKEAEKQLYALTQLALREYVGQYTLDELLEKKESIGAYIERALAEVLIGLGAELISSGIKDIILPGEMKEILNQVLIAEKRAQANSIMRREETASTRSLLNTAKMMEENTMLFKLKEMEFVEKIAEKVNSISVSGNGQMLTQLKQLFSSGNNA